ncbi:MAG: hypothetical protein ACRBCK_10115 [Alphaproteobacteria bacterium]
MTNPYEIFENNRELECEKGVVIEYPGFSFTILRAGGTNTKYDEALARKLRPIANQISFGSMEEGAAKKIYAEVYAETVIVGWDNMADRQGNPLEFNFDNCVQVLLDLPDLFIDIKKQANSLATFKADKDIEKN